MMYYYTAAEPTRGLFFFSIGCGVSFTGFLVTVSRWIVCLKLH